MHGGALESFEDSFKGFERSKNFCKSEEMCTRVVNFGVSRTYCFS